jgi:hypothetical protein
MIMSVLWVGFRRVWLAAGSVLRRSNVGLSGGVKRSEIKLNYHRLTISSAWSWSTEHACPIRACAVL